MQKKLYLPKIPPKKFRAPFERTNFLPNKKFLILPKYLILNFLYLHFLYLSFHFRCFLNMPLLYFILENISRSLFVERFYFFTFYIFFSNWLVFVFWLVFWVFFVTILLLFVFLFFRKILITFTSSFFFQACPCWYLL